MRKIGVVFGLILLSIGLIFGQSISQQQLPSSYEGFKMEDAVINVANTAGKAVVSISTEHTEKIKGQRRYYFGGSPFGGLPEEDESFRKFFEDFFGEMPQREYKQMGLGSGAIISPEGYILTNEHVVKDADKITVTLPDGREFRATIKGVDSRSDLAVIKINASNLPVVKLGDSDTLKIGQWVVAIGNPFGFALQNPEPTVTAGVISALHRSLKRGILRDKDYGDLIQTDAAINPGNSGGPLVNLKGEIVGINVAIFSTSGGYQGLGFAIPINSAKRVLSRLIEGKKIVYGWLGVTVQDLSEELAKYLGLADKNGVLVAKVLENGPADKAGIKERDIIKQFGEDAVNNTRDLLNIVGKTESGRKVKVALMRDKKPLTVEVVVGERPQGVEESAPESKPEKEESKWRGLSVSDLTPELAGRFGIEEKQGVLVTQVEPSSPAESAGIIAGDVLLEINKMPINNVPEYKNALKGLKGDCLVRTQRGYFLVKESVE